MTAFAASAKTILSVRGLKKSYGAVQAVRGVDLDVSEGELVADGQKAREGGAETGKLGALADGGTQHAVCLE